MDPSPFSASFWSFIFITFSLIKNHFFTYIFLITFSLTFFLSLFHLYFFITLSLTFFIIFFTYIFSYRFITYFFLLTFLLYLNCFSFHVPAFCWLFLINICRSFRIFSSVLLFVLLSCPPSRNSPTN